MSLFLAGSVFRRSIWTQNERLPKCLLASEQNQSLLSATLTYRSDRLSVYATTPYSSTRTMSLHNREHTQRETQSTYYFVHSVRYRTYLELVLPYQSLSRSRNFSLPSAISRSTGEGMEERKQIYCEHWSRCLASGHGVQALVPLHLHVS